MVKNIGQLAIKAHMKENRRVHLVVEKEAYYMFENLVLFTETKFWIIMGEKVATEVDMEVGHRGGRGRDYYTLHFIIRAMRCVPGLGIAGMFAVWQSSICFMGLDSLPLLGFNSSTAISQTLQGSKSPRNCKEGETDTLRKTARSTRRASGVWW